MTPETADYLAKARDYLRKARDQLDGLRYCDEAARAAYPAGFHAAEALILARTGRIAKSHSGLRATFAQLTKDEATIDRKFTRFLARGYSFKEVTDYAVGPHAVVTGAEAEEMIAIATELVERVAQVLA